MPSRCSNVDLPAPDGPMMETNSPSLISTLTRRRTKVFVGPCSKYFSTLRRTISGELIVYLSIVTHIATRRRGLLARHGVPEHNSPPAPQQRGRRPRPHRWMDRWR